jgi:hypothetical protein
MFQPIAGVQGEVADGFWHRFAKYDLAPALSKAAYGV